MQTPRRGRRAVVAGVMALSLVLLAGPAAASFTTSSHTTYTDKETTALEGTPHVPPTHTNVDDGGALGGAPTGVAVADFNLDGHDDVAVTTGNPFLAEEAWTFTDGVAVLYGAADGTLSRPVYYPLGGKEYSYGTSLVPRRIVEAGQRGAADVVAEDLNGDTRPDLAVANSVTNSVSVLINTVINTGVGPVTANDGNQSFAAPRHYPTGSSPSAVAAAVLDGANGVDLVTANSGSGDVTLLHNQGQGTYPTDASKAGHQTVSVGASPQDVAAGDLDGDSDQDDVVTANSGSDSVSRLLDGSGSANSYSIGSNPDRPKGVAIGDVDGDGDADVATANFGSDDASVLLNDGSGGLSTTADGSPYTVGLNPAAVVLAHLADSNNNTAVDDKNDVVDLAVANRGDDTVSVLGNNNDAHGDSTPRFQSHATPDVGRSPVALAAGDFDRDAISDSDVDFDLVTANNNSEDITVLQNQ
jgi:hypothetical protein